MELLWKAVSAALLISILGIVLGNKEKSFQTLLSISGCIILLAVIFRFLYPLIDFLKELEILGSLNGDYLGIILKAVGIAYICEISSSVCAESGNASLGKLIHLLGTICTLWISLPVFKSVIKLIHQILEVI